MKLSATVKEAVLGIEPVPLDQTTTRADASVRPGRLLARAKHLPLVRHSEVSRNKA
jgi:hypothetical protein